MNVYNVDGHGTGRVSSGSYRKQQGQLTLPVPGAIALKAPCSVHPYRDHAHSDYLLQTGAESVPQTIPVTRVSMGGG